MAKGAAMGEVFVRVMRGKRNRLQGERCRNQQQNRKPPYARAVKCHRRLNYTSVRAGAGDGREGLTRRTVRLNQAHGSTSLTPQCSKSPVFRVASTAPQSRA